MGCPQTQGRPVRGELDEFEVLGRVGVIEQTMGRERMLAVPGSQGLLILRSRRFGFT